MGILSDFERRLEGVIEGIFTKAFRTGLQPVELATRILREMENGKTIGVHEVWVPNRYTFWLSETDRERFSQTERALLRELRQVVEDGARERGWSSNHCQPRPHLPRTAQGRGVGRAKG